MRKDRSSPKLENSKPTYTEILDEPIGRAFVIGVLLGFGTAKDGRAEPEIDEIEEWLERIQEDLVLAIQPRNPNETAD